MNQKTLQEKLRKKSVKNVFNYIYDIIINIPKGKVMTYGQVAIFSNTTPRVVGFALHANRDPKTIPCHRVVSKEGKLTGYAFGGIKKKRELLIQEGVIFLDYQTIDLTKSLYIPTQ